MMVERVRISIRGAVQGVGFRPFVYRLAQEMRIGGWVNNGTTGVTIEAEGEPEQLARFIECLEAQKPPHAIIQSFDVQSMSPQGEQVFLIAHSQIDGEKAALILPDLATCPDCLRELFDPADRRYRYPFINCTHCGPRFTIIEALPYDRPNTTMRHFPMCPECLAEYEDPANRRFHAQPIACPRCGPQIALWSNSGQVLETRDAALLAAAEAVREGAILALKGLGGFQLICDARHEEVVHRLRLRKGRERKPFAVMYPSLDTVRTVCAVNDEEAALLTSPAAPIVLLERAGDGCAPSVAPDNPYLGVMLPYTPLHHLLMHELGFPIVATSGNASGDTIITDEGEALEKLAPLADLFLVHDRPIARHADDSVCRVMAGRPVVLRRARGYAPLPISLPGNGLQVLAAGAHLKNTLALTRGGMAFVSQHIGDLDTDDARITQKAVARDLMGVMELAPSVTACDLHPDYASTIFAETLGLPITRVQHHYAHVLSCMAEHQLEPPVLGVSWDGTGYGTDGTIWGGEWLLISARGWERIAGLRPFPLPGGEAAVREGRRAALGLLWSLYGDSLPLDNSAAAAFSAAELRTLKRMLRNGLNTPLTSSAGRLFDAVAALLGVCQYSSFEGEAAMRLEYAAHGIKGDDRYSFAITDITTGKATTARMIDVEPVISALLDDLAQGLPAGVIAAAFHRALADVIVRVALIVREWKGVEQVVLSGGCFANKRLLEDVVVRLRQAGLRPYFHERVPTNDGGIALGQALAVLREQTVCV